MKNKADLCSLIHLRSGATAEVINISGLDNNEIKKLTVFGIIPGENIVLLQKFPSYVLRIGNTTVAVDKDIAACISVKEK